MSSSVELRASLVAELIRAARLVVVLRRVAPRARLLDLVDELASAGVRVFEITFDADDAADAAADLEACRTRLPSVGPDRCLVGAGTLRTTRLLEIARGAGAEFGVSPVLDPAMLSAALKADLPFIPGAYSPTEIELAWRSGATFVKLFPASSLRPTHIRELRGPMPEVELVPTGGIDATNARAWLEAGAVAVGIGSAIVRGGAVERRAIVAAVGAAVPES